MESMDANQCAGQGPRNVVDMAHQRDKRLHRQSAERAVEQEENTANQSECQDGVCVLKWRPRRTAA